MRVPTWLLCVLCVLPAFAAARPPEVDLRNVAGPWTQVHLDANGIGFHTLLSGPPTARRVVFLHGFPDLAVTWRRTWELLGHDDFRMVAPDLRGYGGTDAPKGGYDIDTLSEDVLELAAASARADGEARARADAETRATEAEARALALAAELVRLRALQP